MLFGREGLDSEIKFVIAATYELFQRTWGDLHSEKIDWVDTWSGLLKSFDAKTIKYASEYCVQNLRGSPTLPIFRIYCQRVRDKKRLSDPIVSNIEKIARTIIELPEHDIGYSSYSELSDACLIVAAIASAKANDEVGLKWDENMVDIELSGRARMFGLESISWAEDAKEGKGYWCDLLCMDK